MMKHVIVLSSEDEFPSPAMFEALREAGIAATVATTASAIASATHAKTHGSADQMSVPPFAVLYEVGVRADIVEVHAAVSHAMAAWPEALIVACRRHSSSTPAEAYRPGGRPRGLEASTLKRLGFRAIADEPAQLPALLHELQARGGVTGELPSLEDEMESALPSLLLPDKLNVARLRAAFEMVSSLHFASDQKSAAATALAGLASLVRADRWTIYLTAETSGAEEASLEPLAVRGLTESERALPEGDWRHALLGDALALTGAESRAARAAARSAETIRDSEGERRVVAVPLISGERLLGVLEVVREQAAARPFSAREAALLSALAVPLAAALANSVRIAEAERLSQTDDLTKLYNARFLRQFLTGEIKRARRYNTMVTALFLDLDDFKNINDRYGHLVGSHVLMEMAAVILASVRDTDIVARYGGDEFVVILPESGLEQAARVAERVRARVAGHIFTGGRRLSLTLTASFGVAAFPQHAQSPQRLIACADRAMYEAKAARKNCVRLAAEESLESSKS